MSSVARRPVWLDERDNHGHVDHFTWFVTAHNWTSLAADAGSSAAVGDAAGGVLALGTGATDNNEAAVRATNETYLMAAGKPLWCLARVQFTEANTDDANVCVGFANAIGANLLVDDGGGCKTTGNYALVYKVDGGTVWRCRSRNGTETTDNATSVTAGGASYQELEIEIQELDTLKCEITYKVDGAFLRDATTGDVIRHTLLYASATEMHVGAYVKAGGANAETLNVDLLAAGQVR